MTISQPLIIEYLPPRLRPENMLKGIKICQDFSHPSFSVQLIPWLHPIKEGKFF
jgi:hypothetical protein